MSDEQRDEWVPVAGSALIEDGDRDLYAAAAEHFPTEAHKTDMRGQTEITYLEGEDIITRMNKVFVYGWESEVVAHGINEDADEVWVRMRVTIWRKATLRTATIVEGETQVTTTGYTEQLIPIKREQFGSQKLKRARSTGKILDIGFDLKGAATDAIKKTVSLLGVGLYLWNKEERALVQWAIQEMKQEQRQQARQSSGGQQEEQGQDAPQQGSGRFRRPNRTTGSGTRDQAPTSPPASDEGVPAKDGKLVINGKTMPDGFQQPFALMDQGKEQNQCRAEQCGTVIDPNGDYTVGGEQKKGGYVMKRSKEMAGCVLCSSHAAQWYRALKTAQSAA